MFIVGRSRILILRFHPFAFLEINPLDYVYKSLGCRLELLNPDSDECQLILEYMHNSREWFVQSLVSKIGSWCVGFCNKMGMVRVRENDVVS